MHAPRPYGLAVYGGELTNDDLAFIDSIAKRLTNIKRTGELDSLKLVYDLPNGGAVIVYDMGGVFRAIANKPAPTPQDDEHDYMAHSHIPMLYSGVITRAIVKADEGVAMTITEWTRRRLDDYNLKRRKAPQRLELQRFVIDYHNRVREFEPNPPPPRKHTQYTRQRPTWYSGSMAKVMQIVGGYGRQDLKELPENDWERAMVRLPDNIKKAIDNELADKLLPAYTGYPPKDGQYQYDYKHSLTHGVGFDDENKPWLLSISRKGVYAMPLPMIPATTTTAYREWIESVGDSEILSILDTFGGLPSGESFPTKESDFKAWERAGVIIRVDKTDKSDDKEDGGLKDFYRHIAYSTACGWSLNMLGSDGYNTCYDYNDRGLVVGYTYNMTLTLKAVADNGRITSNKKTLSDSQAQELSRYLNNLVKDLDNRTAKGASIRYKLRRMTDGELYQKMGMSVEDWENLEMPPIAKHSGQVRQVYEGLIWAMPNVKVPEPMLGGCISIMPDGWRQIPHPKKTDTPVLAYYVGDDLHVVKYYIDDTKFEKEVETNFEEYMTVGQWYKIETYGKSGLHGDIYLTLKDDRVVFGDSEKKTIIEGKDAGYTRPSFIFDFYWYRVGTLYRERYYTHKTNIAHKHGQRLSLGVIMPYYCRNNVLYAKTEYVAKTEKSERVELKSVRDPHSYRIWTDTKSLMMSGYMEGAKGKPYPEWGRPVWAEIHQYQPNMYSDFADLGDWVGGLPADVSHLMYDGQGWAKTEWTKERKRPPPNIRTYYTSQYEGQTITHELCLDDDKIKIINQDEPYWYYEVSPDEFFNFCYKDACKNVMGETEYSNVSEQVDGKRKAWGNSQFINSVEHDTAHHFIGVINE